MNLLAAPSHTPRALWTNPFSLLSLRPPKTLTKFELGWQYSYYTDPRESSQMNLSLVTVQREGQALSVPYNLGFTFDFWASQRHWFSLIRLAKLPDVRQYSWTSLEISIDSQWSQAHTWFVWIFWWYRFKGTCPSFIHGPNQQLWLVSNGWSLGDPVSMIYRLQYRRYAVRAVQWIMSLECWAVLQIS